MMKYQHPPKFEPTPKHIAQQCAIIQAGWSDGERESRARWLLQAEEVRLPFAFYVNDEFETVYLETGGTQ